MCDGGGAPDPAWHIDADNRDVARRRSRAVFGGELRPVTERILARLPGPRAFWIVAWALVPALNAGANSLLGTQGVVWEQSDTLVVLNYIAVSVAVVITLSGTGRIAQRLEGLRESSPSEHFREMNSVLVPLLAAAATALAFAIAALVDEGLTSALVRAVTWLLLGIPFWTFLWTYASLQLGLDRLGRERLVPDSARIVDPGLGLRPLGRIAFMALWMLLAWLVPVLLTGLPDVVGVSLGLLLVAAGLGTFVLSMWRLHRQMVELKANELGIARELYAAAYEPVRSAQTLDALDEQRSLLGAADALEKRARAIHEWPIDEGTWARVLTIVTSVIALTIGRLILDPLGL
jgi:hypothetical protein